MENEARSGKRHQGGLQESSMEEQTNISKEEGVLKKNSMENLQAQSKQADDSQKDEHDKQSFDDDDTFPFQLKWPLTRAERIRELEQMVSYYEGTPQTCNIPAAIAWHSEFPPDEIVPEGEVMSQKGKKSRSQIFDGRMEHRGSSVDEFADQSGAPQPDTVLNGASHPTQIVQYTYYDRDSAPPGHMYQV